MLTSARQSAQRSSEQKKLLLVPEHSFSAKNKEMTAQGASVHHNLSHVQGSTRTPVQMQGMVFHGNQPVPRSLHMPDVTGQKYRQEMDEKSRRWWQEYIAEHGVDPITHKLMRADPKYQQEHARAYEEAMERIKQRDRQSALKVQDAKLMAKRGRQQRVDKKLGILNHQFTNEGVHLRKTRTPEDEHHYVLNPRNPHHPEAASQDQVDAGYWHATSTVMKNLPLQQYDSFSSSGLVISNKVPLGGWGKADLGLPTKNVPRDRYPRSFPPTAFPQANGKTLGTMPEVTGKLNEMRMRVHGAIPDQSTTGKLRGMNRNIMIDGMPMPIGGMKTPYHNAASLPYNEAQIHYNHKDVLAVHTELLPDDPEKNPEPHKAAIDALRHVDRLRFDHGVDVPIVQYHLGQMHTHQSREAFVEHLRTHHPKVYSKVRKEGLHKPKRP